MASLKMQSLAAANRAGRVPLNNSHSRGPARQGPRPQHNTRKHYSPSRLHFMGGEARLQRLLSTDESSRTRRRNRQSQRRRNTRILLNINPLPQPRRERNEITNLRRG
ncbi:hypothetical protein EVAR_44068_1 [Eumeta japonica]|uniref:Uncharacterized protein n=1 Tax=Eumeta variegata TaxID=151549 RepID=A0A4C1X0Q1_EUMVA|nr:hypothetical protein EVAR_44068_1 [Eumeta japonica]